jgi:hypothetical protein
VVALTGAGGTAVQHVEYTEDMTRKF